jgi:hypothetical protein
MCEDDVCSPTSLEPKRGRGVAAEAHAHTHKQKKGWDEETSPGEDNTKTQAQNKKTTKEQRGGEDHAVTFFSASS